MAIDILAPEDQEGTKAIIKTWLKRVGDEIRLHDPVVELETDKVAVEVAATANGVLSEILITEGMEVEPGTVLGRIASDGAHVAAKPARAAAAAVPMREAVTSDAARMSPGLRRLLSDHNLDVNDVPVSGDKLSREDVQAEIDRRAKGGAKPAALTLGAQVVPHNSMRRRIADHLAQSLRDAPHVTAVFEADMSAIAAHRAKHKAAFERAGANLTYTAYFVAASVAAMKAAPAVNGRWFEERVEIYDDVNIGIGTALGEKGLIVPVIHGAQKLSLEEIAKKLTELTEKARAGKLTKDEVQKGTFSISNHGVSGSLLAAPIIINQPQSAILGIGKLEKRAVVREVSGRDEIQIRPMAYVTLTIDHRVIDAHQTNAWLSRFVETLESWPE